MQTFRRARGALDDVSESAAQVGDAAQAASTALVCVAAVSLLALGIALMVLVGVTSDA